MSNQKKLCFQEQTNSGLVEVWQENTQRWLTIDNIEQSRIDIENKEKLLAPLHHAFLATLLFIETPKKLLLAGLGGGAVARYLCSYDSHINGDAVEIDKVIANLAVQNFEFPDKNLSIHVDDIRQWHGSNYDLIIVDIAENALTPNWLVDESFLSKLKQQLSSDGVIVFNILVNDTQSFSNILLSVRTLFNRKTLCLTVPDHKNIVISAFNKQPRYHSSEQLTLRAKALTAHWHIDFDALYAQLKIDNPSNSGVI